MYLEAPDAAEPQPSGWSQHADFSLTLLSQTDRGCNSQQGPTSHTLNHKKFIIDDTIIIKCDITNISSKALTQQRETRIVDADTAAAASSTPHTPACSYPPSPPPSTPAAAQTPARRPVSLSPRACTPPAPAGCSTSPPARWPTTTRTQPPPPMPPVNARHATHCKVKR